VALKSGFRESDWLLGLVVVARHAVVPVARALASRDTTPADIAL
jgi:hypothetical protein